MALPQGSIDADGCNGDNVGDDCEVFDLGPFVQYGICGPDVVAGTTIGYVSGTIPPLLTNLQEKRADADLYHRS